MRFSGSSDTVYGAWRAKRNIDQRIGPVLIVQGKALAQVLVTSAGPTAVESPESGTAMARMPASSGLGGGFGEKIHIGKTRGARTEHLSNREFGAIAHKIGRRPVAPQARCAVPAIPSAVYRRHNRAASHRSVSVGVYEPGYKGVARQLNPVAGVEVINISACQAEGDDPPVITPGHSRARIWPRAPRE